MMTRLGIALLLTLLLAGEAFASAAAQRQRGVRAHRQIDLYPEKNKKAVEENPYHTFENSPAKTQGQPVKTQAPTSAPVYIPPNKVLVSSPVSKNQPSQGGNKNINTAPASGNQNNLPLGLAALMTGFDKSSEMWMQLDDMRVKMLIVQRYIQMYQDNEIYIRKPSIYYVNLISSMAAGNPAMLRNPFDRVLMTVAIIDYDFDNGENPDVLARRILVNDRAFQENKKRVQALGQM